MSGAGAGRRMIGGGLKIEKAEDMKGGKRTQKAGKAEVEEAKEEMKREVKGRKRVLRNLERGKMISTEEGEKEAREKVTKLIGEEEIGVQEKVATLIGEQEKEAQEKVARLIGERKKEAQVILEGGETIPKAGKEVLGSQGGTRALILGKGAWEI